MGKTYALDDWFLSFLPVWRCMKIAVPLFLYLYIIWLQICVANIGSIFEVESLIWLKLTVMSINKLTVHLGACFAEALF